MKTFLRAAGLLAALTLAPLAANAAGAGSGTSTYQCAPYEAITSIYPSGNSYTADADGIITGVNPNDQNSMENGGCQLVGAAGYTMLGRIIGANMNSTADQKVAAAQWFVAPNAYYMPGEMVAKDCSVSLTTAAGAVYDAAAKGGNRIFGSGAAQAFTGCTGSGTGQHVAAITGSAVVDAGSTLPIFSLTTGQGAPATANIYFFGYILGQ